MVSRIEKSWFRPITQSCGSGLKIAESGFVLSQKSAQAAPDVKLWRNKIGSGQELYHNRIRILFELKKT